MTNNDIAKIFYTDDMTTSIAGNHQHSISSIGSHSHTGWSTHAHSPYSVYIDFLVDFIKNTEELSGTFVGEEYDAELLRMLAYKLNVEHTKLARIEFTKLKALIEMRNL